MAKGHKGGRRPPPKGKGAGARAEPATPTGPGGPAAEAGRAPAAAGAGAAGPAAAPARPSPSSSGGAKPTRTERLEAERAARRRRALRTRLILVGVVVAVVGGVAAVVVTSRQEEQRAVDEVTTGSCKYDEEYDRDEGRGRNHVANPTYGVDPPAGGDHASSAAAAGRYTAANAPADGQLVHALEHGFVVLWHRPDLSEADRTAVDGVADRFREELLIVPRASLPVPVAATSWHRRLLCQQAEPEAIGDFIRNFRDQGPEMGFL